jgi:hypothetical protein
MNSVQLMEKVAEVSPEAYRYLINTSEEVRQSPFKDEIIAELDGITKKAAHAFNNGHRAINSAANSIGRTSLALGGMFATGVGLALAGDLYDAAKRGITKTRDYKAMLSSNPDLKDKPARQVQSLFSTLHKFNPEFASDPLVAGSFVRNHVEMANSEQGAVDINVLNSLVSSRKNLQDSKKLNPFKFGK